MLHVSQAVAYFQKAVSQEVILPTIIPDSHARKRQLRRDTSKQIVFKSDHKKSVLPQTTT